MLSDALTDGLKQYGIGAKIRALRLEKKLGQVQLGEHTGLSPGHARDAFTLEIALVLGRQSGRSTRSPETNL